MWTTLTGFGLVLVLATAVLPVPRVRRLLLTALARLGQAAVLTFLGACGTFFIQPEAAPAWVQALLHPVLEGTHEFLPASLDAMPGAPWLILAVLAVAVSLPLLIVIELAASLSSQLALVQSLRQELRAAAGWFDGRLTALGVTGPAYPPAEAPVTSRAQRPAGPAAGNAAMSAPRVLDLLK